MLFSKADAMPSSFTQFTPETRGKPRRRGRASGHSFLQHCAPCLCLIVLTPTLHRSSAQDSAPHREFSAYVLMRMGGEKPGVGARLYVKEDNLYLDFPDLVNNRRMPFWFLSNGLVASVKPAKGKDFNAIFAGLLLRFRPRNPDRLCDEFRPYYIEILNADGSLTEEDLKNLQNSENFPCEQTGHEIIARRDCRTYRLGNSESSMTISFDPKLEVILQVEDPLEGLGLRLDAIKVGPQPDSLFVLPHDHVVLVDPARLRQSPME